MAFTVWLVAAALLAVPPGAGAAGCDTCSADGQRACCVFPADGDGLSPCPAACDGGLLKILETTGTCSIHKCYDTEPCGGSGERACCQPPFEDVGPVCDPGLGEFTPCDLGFEDCLCSEVAGVAIEASGVCKPVVCGGENERACCGVGTDRAIAGTGGEPCHAGLIEVEVPNSGQCSGALTGFVDSNGICVDPKCGGEGERACCINEQLAMGVGACESGLVEVAGYKSESGDGTCIGPLALGESSGTCHRPTPCGGAGQRACCFIERPLEPCDEGLHEIDGCAGDCFCGGGGSAVDATTGISSSSCLRFDIMSEPAIGFTAPPPGGCSLRGYADVHMHMFADIAHGGGILAGSACPPATVNYCPDVFTGTTQILPGGCSNTYCNETLGGADVNDALADCYGSHRNLVDKNGNALPNPEVDLTPHCPVHLPGCGTALMHGDHTLFDDAVGSDQGTLDGSKSNLGAPLFNGWPQWSTTTHQQVYYKWLERAWRGGLKLLVQLAVNNTALCQTNKRIAGVDCDDTMAFIDQQLQAAYDFERFVDLVVGGGTDTDSGWFRIVLTPREARREIARGNMAVVLGIEVDNLFNCRFPSSECTIDDHVIDSVESCSFTLDHDRCGDPSDPTKTSEQWVREQVDHYYDTWGVRHMFPIHNFDNSFGGTATWQDAIEIGNRFVEGHWYLTQDCWDQGYRFKLGSFTTTIAPLFGFGELTADEYPGRLESASCNAFGLFPLGETLINRMMERGMVVDVDHMSNESLDDTIALAQSFRDGGYPLTASHALFFSLNDQQIRHERMRTQAQLAAMDAMGSMVGVMLKDDVLDRDTRGERKTLDYAASGLIDDCRHSSKTFAQGYLYGVDTMSGRAAMGSDFNGVAGHFGPRFGSDACGGAAGDILLNADIQDERSKQLKEAKRVAYPFTLDEFGTFDRQVSGQKTFDYNVDGMAHVGLLPDFVADLEAIGVAGADLDPLLRSAERYIQMWELARGDTVLDSLVDGCEDCSVTDATAPVVTCPADVTVECTGASTPATFGAATATEECTSASTPSCAPASGAGFGVGETTVTCTSTDESANTGQCSFAVTVVDTTTPTITCPPPVQARAETGDPVAVDLGTPTGADACGAVTLSDDAPGTFPIGTTTVTHRAADPQGLAATCTQTVEVLRPPLNHFQCYDVRGGPFDRIEGVSLADDLGERTIDLRKPKRLCAPMSKDGEDPGAPNDPDHLVGYKLGRGDPRFKKVEDVVVEDQFGTLVVDAVSARLLLVPTAKSFTDPAPPLDLVLVDHYQCYKVRGDRRRVGDVPVEDQFGQSVADVKRPRHLCLPVDKNGEGVFDGTAGLMCYQIRPGEPVGREVFLDNQLGPDALVVRRAREICVPATATAPAAAEG